MYRTFMKFILVLILGFTAAEGAGSAPGPAKPDFEHFYAQVLKPAYDKIAPLRNYAQQRQRTYIISAILAIVVFALFVRFFQATGALIALIMIVVGIWYLKSAKPVVGPYKQVFAETILTPLSQHCCGFKYRRGGWQEEEIVKSGLFSPRIKSFEAVDGIWEKAGIKAGYVSIVFDTKENASVERFARNLFSGYVIEIPANSDANGTIITDLFKHEVADDDPEFSAFFSTYPRKGHQEGLEIYGDVPDSIVEKCVLSANEPVAAAFLPNKILIFYILKSDPLEPPVATEFTLKKALAYKAAFEKLDALTRLCR